MIKNQIRIQFVDTDMSHRIHYSAIFRYFEINDHNFFRTIGYPYTKIFEMGYDMPRVHVNCDFLGSIWYDDVLEVETFLTKVGNSSYSFGFRFQKEGQLVAKGGLTNVFIDRSTGKGTPIPAEIKAKLLEHLENENDG